MLVNKRCGGLETVRDRGDGVDEIKRIPDDWIDNFIMGNNWTE